VITSHDTDDVILAVNAQTWHWKVPEFGLDRCLFSQRSVSMMRTSHLKTGAVPNPETSCISTVLQTMDNVQHSVPVMNQPLSQTFREPTVCNFAAGKVLLNKSKTDVR
jgi:hypothetical protein